MMNQYIRKLLARLQGEDVSESLTPLLGHSLFDDPFENSVTAELIYPLQQYSSYLAKTMTSVTDPIAKEDRVDILNSDLIPANIPVILAEEVDLEEQGKVELVANLKPENLNSVAVRYIQQQARIRHLLPKVDRHNDILKPTTTMPVVAFNQYFTSVVNQVQRRAQNNDQCWVETVESCVSSKKNVIQLKPNDPTASDTRNNSARVIKQRDRLKSACTKPELHIGNLNVSVDSNNRPSKANSAQSRNQKVKRKPSYRKSKTRRPNHGFGIKQM